MSSVREKHQRSIFRYQIIEKSMNIAKNKIYQDMKIPIKLIKLTKMVMAKTKINLENKPNKHLHLIRALT